MTYFAITAQYPVFTELNGTPLENGYVWIGEPGTNPVTNPQTVYWDDDLLYPAAQPVRTIGGAPNKNGTPGSLFTPGDFSILIQDKNGNQVYYNQYGIKNYTDNVNTGYNYIQNPNFEIFQRFTSADRWIADTSGYSLAEYLYIFAYNQSDIPGKPRYAKKLVLYGGSSLVSDYGRYVQVVEDVYKLSGETITLSFWAKADSGLLQIATSFDQVESFNPATPTNQGIAPMIHTLTADWRQYSVTTTLPTLYGGGAEGVLDTRDTGTQINFWLGAGSDYDDQTNGLGLGDGTLYITDVRLCIGSQIDTSKARDYSQELLLCERYYEKSGADLQIPGDDNDNGSIIFIAYETGTDLPGFRYRTRKRIVPTVTVYSPDADDQADLVYYYGTGQIAVSSYNWVGETGISAMTLGSAKVVGGLYQYHYSVDAEFIL